MSILAIDPGTEKSGWCRISEGGDVIDFGWTDNQQMLIDIQEGVLSCDEVVIEDISNYGMAVGRDTFETVKWMGRFDVQFLPEQLRYITRPTIKAALCNNVKATDANVRQAVIDWYGGDAIAIGGKKCLNCKGKGWTGREHAPCQFCHEQYHDEQEPYLVGCGYETHPGQLYGVSSHVWSALALGITYIEQEKAKI